MGTLQFERASQKGGRGREGSEGGRAEREGGRRASNGAREREGSKRMRASEKARKRARESKSERRQHLSRPSRAPCSATVRSRRSRKILSTVAWPASAWSRVCLMNAGVLVILLRGATLSIASLASNSVVLVVGGQVLLRRECLHPALDGAQGRAAAGVLRNERGSLLERVSVHNHGAGSRGKGPCKTQPEVRRKTAEIATGFDQKSTFSQQLPKSLTLRSYGSA